MPDLGHLSPPARTSTPSGTEVGVFDLPDILQSPVPFTLAAVEIPTGRFIEEHSHEVREIWVLTHGSGILTVDGKESLAFAGETLYFESHQKHQMINNGSSPIKITSIWWQP